MQASLHWVLVRYLLIALVVIAARFLIPVPGGPAQSALTITICAIAAIVAMLVFWPQPRMSAVPALQHALAVSVVLLVIMAADPLLQPLWVYIPRIAITFLMLSATISIAAAYLPMQVLVAGFLLLTFLPVWAAPFVELTGNPPILTNVVIAASPLTAIAVALDFDFLRAGWFYANSALGSMRYDYPDLASVWLVLAVIPASASIVEIRRLMTNSPIRYAREAEV